jgi:hypothetical protein
MKELLKDAWAVVESTVSGLWEVAGDIIQLAIIDDPFWRGVEMTIIAGLLISKRHAIFDIAEKTPLVGGILVYVPRKIDEGINFLMFKLKEGMSWLRSKTLEPVKIWISKVDDKLRKK